MEIYGGFAESYDKFMDNIPYEEWHVYLRNLLQEQRVTEGVVLDLACGTGNMTWRLAADGYDMIGLDQSWEMLNAAWAKCPDSVLLLQQDMREFTLYGSAAAIVCVCDGMNYLLSEEDLLSTFRRVDMFLDPDGVFIFDMKTAYFYQNSLGSRTITDQREDAALIWENEYHPDTGLHEYLVTIYQLADVERDLYERIEEYHRQQAYPVERVKRLLEESGLCLKAVYNAFTHDAPKENSERLYFVAGRA